MASAIVLCAGFGTRLRPLTDELPKALVPVGDRSVLEHTVARLSRARVADVVLNVHHLSGLFDRYIARLPVPARVLVEIEIKGTAGGVAAARHHFRSTPVLVWNGDILADPPIDTLLANPDSDHFCLGVAPRPLGEGTVGIDERGRVVRLRGEHFGIEARGGDYVGVLALGAAVLDALPERGCLFGDAALPRLRAGGTVTTASVTRPWADVGDLRGLWFANQAWLAARELEHFMGEGAALAPAVTLRCSVVGARARIEGHGLLERCVVCPGATATAPLSDAIVAPSGRVLTTHA